MYQKKLVIHRSALNELRPTSHHMVILGICEVQYVVQSFILKTHSALYAEACFIVGWGRAPSTTRARRHRFVILRRRKHGYPNQQEAQGTQTMRSRIACVRTTAHAHRIVGARAIARGLGARLGSNVADYDDGPFARRRRGMRARTR